jgi:undecaprenyl phosphate-alpha-L-ara4N flippase subunit ArnE
MAFKLKSSKSLLFSMLVVSALLAATGQLLFKLGVSNLASIPTALLYLIPGLIAYGVSISIYFVVLSRSHLSWAYGLNGISYVVAVFLALSVLHENIPALRWVGVAVIAIGAALIGFS